MHAREHVVTGAPRMSRASSLKRHLLGLKRGVAAQWLLRLLLVVTLCCCLGHAVGICI